jgi:hypothetical protein
MYSLHQLSRLKILDTTATHMGGGTHLLSPEAVQVVSAYPTQIITSTKKPQTISIVFPNLTSYVLNGAGMTLGLRGVQTEASSVPIGHAKLILLRAIFQPALEWFSVTQLYCRKLGSQDKHHR